MFLPLRAQNKLEHKVEGFPGFLQPSAFANAVLYNSFIKVSNFILRSFATIIPAGKLFPEPSSDFHAKYICNWFISACSCASVGLK